MTEDSDEKYNKEKDEAFKLRGLDIVCIAWHWDALIERPHQEMLLFSKFNRVLYVETESSMLSGLKGRKRLRKINDNLLVYSPPCLPLGLNKKKGLKGLNERMAVRGVRRTVKKLGFKDFILWPYIFEGSRFAGKLGERLVCYVALAEADTAPEEWRGRAVEEEKHLVDSADIIFAESKPIFERKRKIHKNVYLARSAAPPEHFGKARLEDTKIPEDMAGIKKPIIGNLGAFGYLEDIGLMEYLAKSRPDWQFVMIGPVVNIDVSSLKQLKNIHMLGRKDYSVLPNYLKGFDVCIKTFKKHERMKYSSPLTLYEYMGTGKPIVTTDFPEAREYEEVIRVAETHEEFLRHLEEALKERDENLVEKRLMLARQNSWEARCRFMAEKINSLTDG